MKALHSTGDGKTAAQHWAAPLPGKAATQRRRRQLGAGRQGLPAGQLGRGTAVATVLPAPASLPRRSARQPRSCTSSRPWEASEMSDGGAW